MSETLKPCPFCGGEVFMSVSDYGDTHYWRVHCNGGKCPFYVSAVFYTEAEAVKAWNTRAERTCRNSADAPSIFRCSECQLAEFDFGKWNYCPNCGARIER